MGSGYSTRTSYSANISTSRDPNAYRSGQVTSPTEGDLWNRVGGDVQNIAGQGANSLPGVAEARRVETSSFAGCALDERGAPSNLRHA